MKKLYTVHLSRKQQDHLHSLVTKGSAPVRVITRAHILLKAHKKLKDADIAKHVGCTTQHVESIRKRFCKEGMDRALSEKQRSGRPQTFTVKDKTRIVAIACTDPPDEADYWTAELLAEKAIETGVVPKISKQTIWLILKEHDLKPWREKNVVHSDSHAGVQGAHGRHPDALRKAL
jgi:transposase